MRKVLLCTLLFLTSVAFAQDAAKAAPAKADAAKSEAAKPGLLTAAELKQLIPQTYFYASKTATVQVRNSAGLRTESGKIVLSALVDTGGYSTQIAERYQGFLLTDTKVTIGGKELAPGAYGIGVVGTKFLVTDLGANEIFSTDVKDDAKMKRPTPLKMVRDADGTELCLGRKCVEFSAH